MRIIFLITVLLFTLLLVAFPFLDCLEEKSILLTGLLSILAWFLPSSVVRKIKTEISIIGRPVLFMLIGFELGFPQFTVVLSLLWMAIILNYKIREATQ